MERRGFLQAMVSAVTATTATLALKPSDAGILVPDHSIVLAPQSVVPTQSGVGMLYDIKGRPVMFVREAHVRHCVDELAQIEVGGYVVDGDSVSALHAVVCHTSMVRV